MEALPEETLTDGLRHWPTDRLRGALAHRAEHTEQATTREAIRLLGELIQRRADLDRAALQPWLDAAATRPTAAGLAALSADPHVAEALRDTLATEPTHADVPALCALLRRGDHRAIDPTLAILRELPTDGNPAAFLITALGRFGDHGVASALRDLVATAAPRALWHLQTALFRITGYAPLHDESDAIRRRWATVDLDCPPEPRVLTRASAERDARITVTDGRAVFALDHPDLGPPDTSWPAWTINWTMAGTENYQVGSICGTCEVYLLRTGWAPDEAVELAQRVRDAVADVQAVSVDLLAALDPVLAGLVGGDHHLRLRDTRLCTARSWEETWFSGHPNDPPTGPLTDPLFAPDPTTPLVVAPTQPESRLDPDTVQRYVERIQAGDRPAAIVAAHAAERFVIGWGDDEDRTERSVTGFVLDGHHKLAAYDRLGIPARVLWLCDLAPELAVDPESIFAGLLD